MNKLADHFPPKVLKDLNAEAPRRKHGSYHHPLRHSFVINLLDWLGTQPEQPNRELMRATVQELMATRKALEDMTFAMRQLRFRVQDCTVNASLSLSAKRELEGVVIRAGAAIDDSVKLITSIEPLPREVKCRAEELHSSSTTEEPATTEKAASEQKDGASSSDSNTVTTGE